MLWVLKHLLGRSLLANNAAIHKHNPIGNIVSKFHFVSYYNHCHIIGRKAFDNL